MHTNSKLILRGDKMKIPQLRLIVTSFCGRECIYCRPTGEGLASCNKVQFADIDKVLSICAIYKKHGGTDIKISGGDPIYWPHLSHFIYEVKKQVGIDRIELITRSPKITKIVDELINAGLDVLNFSLDTISFDTYYTVTKGTDFYELIDSIKFCAPKINVKINTVVMKGINDNEIDPLILFCENNGIKQLKLLDIIDDMQDYENSDNRISQRLGIDNLSDVYVSMNEINESIMTRATSSKIVYQGGLGHPMDEYIMPSGLKVTLKNSDNGAWYGSICYKCNRFPCHDALMALRYTPDDMLQFCLLNENARISLSNLSDFEIELKFIEALRIFESARFNIKEKKT